MENIIKSTIPSPGRRVFPSAIFEGFSGTGGSIPGAAREFNADKTGEAMEKIQHSKGLDSVYWKRAKSIWFGPAICHSASCRLVNERHILYPSQSTANPKVPESLSLEL